MFDWVFHVNKIFNGSEILQEKFEQSEQKEANKQTNKQKVFEINCIWDSLYFYIKIIAWKDIHEGVPFYKICIHAAWNWWLSNENDRRLGSKLSLRPISLVL